MGLACLSDFARVVKVVWMAGIGRFFVEFYGSVVEGMES